jgi:hypothetical protein
MMKPTPKPRGPRPVSEILEEVFRIRGFGQIQASIELRNAWREAVGSSLFKLTRLGQVRRNTLTVIVAHSALLEELVAFHKTALLAILQRNAPSTTIRDIRFEVGSINTNAHTS